MKKEGATARVAFRGDLPSIQLMDGALQAIEIYFHTPRLWLECRYKARKVKYLH